MLYYYLNSVVLYLLVPHYSSQPSLLEHMAAFGPMRIRRSEGYPNVPHNSVSLQIHFLATAPLVRGKATAVLQCFCTEGKALLVPPVQDLESSSMADFFFFSLNTSEFHTHVVNFKV